MEQSELKKLLLEVEETARRAGAVIMTHYATGSAVHAKADGSKVTDADLAAENIILPALAALTPHIPIVSEERVAAGDIPDTGKGTFWTVDPLDGTHEFINKTGAFVVAIALVVDHKVVMGVIYHPATDLMYSGCGPGTASKIEGNGVRTPLGKAALSTGDQRVLVNGPHADMARVKGFLTSQFGDAVQLDVKSGIFRACQVADGLADMAVVCSSKRAGHTFWWDVAPGHAIVEAAGGKLETLDGNPLVYNASDLQVPPHVVIAPHKNSSAGQKPSPPPQKVAIGRYIWLDRQPQGPES